MRIKELIEELESLLLNEGNLEVMTSSNYGDYYKTEQLNYIEEVIAGVGVNSAYSGTGLAYNPEEEYGQSERIVILRYTC